LVAACQIVHLLTDLIIYYQSLKTTFFCKRTVTRN